MGQVEGRDAQRPEAAEHGEDTEAQVVPRRHHEEAVLTLCVAGAVALQTEASSAGSAREAVTGPLCGARGVSRLRGPPSREGSSCYCLRADSPRGKTAAREERPIQ